MRGNHYQAKELGRKMSPLTNDDDAMKALRAHSLQVGGIESANKSFDPSSDENQWFDSQEPSTAIERDDTEAWKRLKLGKDLRKLHYDLNGQVYTWIALLSHDFISRVHTPVTQTLELTRTYRETSPLPQRSPVSTRRRARQRRPSAKNWKSQSKSDSPPQDLVSPAKTSGATSSRNKMKC